jgi:hypothetical protein
MKILNGNKSHNKIDQSPQLHHTHFQVLHHHLKLDFQEIRHLLKLENGSVPV